MSDESLVRALADTAREDLATIRKGWRHVLDPIQVQGGGSFQDGPRPKTEDELEVPPDARMDTPVRLAFWVHAAIDEWPAILQTLEPDEHGNLQLVTTQAIDCSDVYAMVDLLSREAERLAGWVDEGRDFGATFVQDCRQLARAVSKVAWPPKGDRMVIGDCPACGRRIRVKAPTWKRVPQPTTDPDAYPLWSDWRPDRDKPVVCRCGKEGTIEEWHGDLVPFEQREPKTARELIDVIVAAGLPRYRDPAIVRQWARQGLVRKVGTSDRGESLYDPVQVLAALTDREARRDERAS